MKCAVMILALCLTRALLCSGQFLAGQTVDVETYNNEPYLEGAGSHQRILYEDSNSTMITNIIWSEIYVAPCGASSTPSKASRECTGRHQLSTTCTAFFYTELASISRVVSYNMCQLCVRKSQVCKHAGIWLPMLHPDLSEVMYVMEGEFTLTSIISKINCNSVLLHQASYLSSTLQPTSLHYSKCHEMYHTNETSLLACHCCR